MRRLLWSRLEHTVCRCRNLLLLLPLLLLLLLLLEWLLLKRLLLLGLVLASYGRVSPGASAGASAGGSRGPSSRWKLGSRRCHCLRPWG